MAPWGNAGRRWSFVFDGEDFTDKYPMWLSDNSIVQQKIDDADIEHSVLIIPALPDIVTDNHFGKRIPGKRQGFVFRSDLCLIFHGVSRLDIGFFAASYWTAVLF